MRTTATTLVAGEAHTVLAKCGHLAGNEIWDLLLAQSGERRFCQRRASGERHGTGCSL